MPLRPNDRSPGGAFMGSMVAQRGSGVLWWCGGSGPCVISCTGFIIRCAWDDVHKVSSPCDISNTRLASPLHPEQAPAQCWLTAALIPTTMSRQVHIIVSHLCMEGRKPQHTFSYVLIPFLILYDLISSQSCPACVWHPRLNCILKVATSQKLCSFPPFGQPGGGVRYLMAPSS